MLKRSRIIKQIADKFKEHGITEMPRVSEFNRLGLMKAHKVRRVFGSFRRAMQLVFIELKRPVDEPEEAVQPPVEKVMQPIEDKAADKQKAMKEAIEKAKEQDVED
jgi:hypothetical protein